MVNTCSSGFFTGRIEDWRTSCHHSPQGDTVNPRIKKRVSFDFGLKWFLYNGYLERNQAEVVLNWLLFAVKKLFLVKSFKALFVSNENGE